MEVTTSSLSGAPLLEVSGEIDHATCDLLSHSMSAALAEDDPIVLVDASQITYLDSSGISLLFATVRRLRNKGWVGIIGANANVGSYDSHPPFVAETTDGCKEKRYPAAVKIGDLAGVN